jgi:hypothetical protein
VTDVVRLPADADPPLGEGRICIRSNGGDGFVVEVYVGRPRPVYRYVSGLECFETALLRARHFAGQIGVAAVYAIGCEDG